MGAAQPLGQGRAALRPAGPAAHLDRPAPDLLGYPRFQHPSRRGGLQQRGRPAGPELPRASTSSTSTSGRRAGAGHRQPALPRRSGPPLHRVELLRHHDDLHLPRLLGAAGSSTGPSRRRCPSGDRCRYARFVIPVAVAALLAVEHRQGQLDGRSPSPWPRSARPRSSPAVRGGYLLVAIGLVGAAVVRPHVSLLVFVAIAGGLPGRPTRHPAACPAPFSLSGITKAFGIVRAARGAAPSWRPPTAHFLKVDRPERQSVSRPPWPTPRHRPPGQLGLPSAQPELADRLPDGRLHRLLPAPARRAAQRLGPGRLGRGRRPAAAHHRRAGAAWSAPSRCCDPRPYVTFAARLPR